MQKFNALGLSVDLMRQNMTQYGFISTAESVTITNTSNEFTADWQNALFGYGLIFLTHYLIRFCKEQSDRMFLAMLTYYLISIMFKPTIGLILFFSPWWIRNYAALGEIVPDIPVWISFNAVYYAVISKMYCHCLIFNGQRH